MYPGVHLHRLDQLIGSHRLAQRVHETLGRNVEGRDLSQSRVVRGILDEALDALIGERHRADQAEVSVDRLETELEAARIAQAEAEADTSELRRTEAERRGQGRWARLRAAWRG